GRRIRKNAVADCRQDTPVASSDRRSTLRAQSPLQDHTLLATRAPQGKAAKNSRRRTQSKRKLTPRLPFYGTLHQPGPFIALVSSTSRSRPDAIVCVRVLRVGDRFAVLCSGLSVGDGMFRVRSILPPEIGGSRECYGESIGPVASSVSEDDSDRSFCDAV